MQQLKTKRAIVLEINSKGRVSGVQIIGNNDHDRAILRGVLARIVNRAAWVWLAELIKTRLVAQQEPAGDANGKGTA